MQLISYIHDIVIRCRKSNLFRDSFWAVLGGGLGKGLAFISGIIIARLLGSTIFGEYSVIRSTLTYIAIISTFGLGYTATKFIAEFHIAKKSKIKHLISCIQWITIITSIVFSLFQIIFAKQISEFIKAPHLYNTIRIFSILTLLNAITTTQLSILAGLKKFKDVAKINIISGVVTFILSVGLSYYWGLNGALIALLLSFIIQAVISGIDIFNCTKQYEYEEKITYKELVEVLHLSFPIALQDGLYAVAHWLSMYILILFSNYSELGLLNAATIWQSLIVSIPIMLKNVMLSHLSSLGDNKNLVNKFIIINLISSAIPALAIIVCSKFISNIYGSTYTGIQPVIIIVSLSSILICLGEVFVYELLSKNRSWLVFISRFVRDFATLAISYYLLCRISHSQTLTYTIIALIIHFVYLLLIYCIYKISSK